jgi:hypothetical protein
MKLSASQVKAKLDRLALVERDIEHETSVEGLGDEEHLSQLRETRDRLRKQLGEHAPRYVQVVAPAMVTVNDEKPAAVEPKAPKSKKDARLPTRRELLNKASQSVKDQVAHLYRRIDTLRDEIIVDHDAGRGDITRQSVAVEAKITSTQREIDKLIGYVEPVPVWDDVPEPLPVAPPKPTAIQRGGDARRVAEEERLWNEESRKAQEAEAEATAMMMSSLMSRASTAAHETLAQQVSGPIDPLDTLKVLDDVKCGLVDLVTQRAQKRKTGSTESHKRLEALLEGYLGDIDTWADMITGKQPILEDRFESWEDAIADVGHANHKESLQEFTKAVTLNRPFLTKPALEQAASHPQLNTSRVAAQAYVMYKARRRALEVAPELRSAVVDVGAGSFGMEMLARLKHSGKSKYLYFHCMSPVLDDADEERQANRRTVGVVRYRDITHPSVMPKAGNVVNFCTHTAAKCTCLQKYDVIQAYASHSGYFFTRADLANLLARVSALWSVEHDPPERLPQPFPVQTPEYEWRDWGRSAPGAVTRWRERAREWLTGRPTLALVGLRGGARNYVNPDTRPANRLGGFHDGPLLQVAEELGRNMGKTVKTAVTVGFSAAITTFLTTPGPLTVRAVCGAVSGVSVAAGVVGGVRVLNDLGSSATPTACVVTSTIKKTSQTVITLESDQEPVCTVYRYTRTSPCELTGQAVGQAAAQEAFAQTAAASLALAGDGQKVRQQVAAIGFRKAVPVRMIRDSINLASQWVNYIAPEPSEGGPPGTRGTKFHLAVICLPFVLASLRKLPLIPGVDWALIWGMSIVPAGWLSPTVVTTVTALTGVMLPLSLLAALLAAVHFVVLA